jgi:hypothetical protein
MSEAVPNAAEAVRENVAQALDDVRRAKAHHRALQGRERPGTDAPAGELQDAAHAVSAAEERLAEARCALLAFFAG